VLRGKKSLVIVPDGILWEVPFQALMPARGRYLLEEYTISYAPSLTSLRELAERHHDARTNTESLLALGNPLLSPEAFGGTAPPALLNAENQLRALRQLYRSTKNDIYFGAEASEECFKADAGKYSLIHLATHGIFDDQNPMASRVLLAKTQQDDGRLEAQEIMRLKLNANLVVLSACETARGRIGPGEGVIGLTWAFLNAGSPTVVVSQWEVREDATAELMKAFYNRINSPSSAAMGRADALRHAALRVMKTEHYRHPFYWAGFVLVGNGF
jgi:CHAT domain-containing protein